MNKPDRKHSQQLRQARKFKRDLYRVALKGGGAQ